jgi:hypothetical protein
VVLHGLIITKMFAETAFVAVPNGDYLQSLLFILASISLGSWSIVLATTLIRSTVQLGYKLTHKQLKVPVGDSLEKAYEEA